MKLTDLMLNQSVIVQLLWGEQKIEFASTVIEIDGKDIYLTPYLHGGSELELNIIPGKGVVCNIFTDNPDNGTRISWKNIVLSTVKKKSGVQYCIKTNVFNLMAEHDDRRQHDRTVIRVNGKVFDGQSENGVDVLVHDISDIGVSFYAPPSFSPNSHQVVVVFSDSLGDKLFNVRLECAMVRTVNKVGNLFIGCRIVKPNKDFQIYGFMRRLIDKNKRKFKEPDLAGNNSVNTQEDTKTEDKKSEDKKSEDNK